MKTSRPDSRRRLFSERLECRNLLTASFGQSDFSVTLDVNESIGDPSDGLSILGQAQLRGSLTPLNSGSLSQLSVAGFEAFLAGNIVHSGTGVIGSFSSDAMPPFVTTLGDDSGVLQIEAEQTGQFQAQLPLQGAVSGVFSIILGGTLDFANSPALFNATATLELDAPELSETLAFEWIDVVAATSPSALPNIDAGLSSLADFVWTDVNGDGVQQVDEPGRGGVGVQLVDTVNGVPDGDDIVVSSGLTDDQGGYSFLNIDPGTYYLKLTGLFFGLNVAAPGQGGDDALDSDFLRDQLQTPLFTFDATPQHLQTVDAGIVAGSPYQNVFNPLNVNRDLDNLVTTEDLLEVVTDLELNQSRELIASPQKPVSDVDVDGNAIADTLDLLIVLEHLLLTAEGGEGERPLIIGPVETGPWETGPPQAAAAARSPATPSDASIVFAVSEQTLESRPWTWTGPPTSTVVSREPIETDRQALWNDLGWLERP